MKLSRYIRQLKIFFVQLPVTDLTKPQEAVEFALASFSFNDQPDRVCSADRVVRDPWREEEHFAFADRHFDRFTILLDLDLDVALELVKKLLALVPVIIFPRIWSPNDHHNEIVVVINALISYGRLKQVPMFFDPMSKIKWRANRHICGITLYQIYHTPNCVWPGPLIAGSI